MRFTSQSFPFSGFFIAWMAPYMGPGTGGHDIFLALWRGFRLSMQTAGALTLVSFVPGLLLHFFKAQWGRRVVLALNGVLLSVLSILFVASFPFYRQFHANFNQMLFTGANDDIYALFITMVQQYYLPVRLAGACCSPASFGAGCARCFPARGSRTARTACACPHSCAGSAGWPFSV